MRVIGLLVLGAVLCLGGLAWADEGGGADRPAPPCGAPTQPPCASACVPPGCV